MENLTPPQVAIDNPATLREVGIHLANLSQSLKEIKDTEKQHHTDNVSRNDTILKKLEEMQNLYPTRAEFNTLTDKVTKDHEDRIRNMEKSLWKWTGIATAVSVAGSLLVQIAFK